MRADINGLSSKEIFYQRRQSIEVLTERLEDPVAVVTMRELMALWQQSDIIIYTKRPKNFDSGFSLSSRIRGALGKHLEYYEIPFLYEVMFGQNWIPFSQTATARPYIIDCIPQGDLIKIRLGMFGFFRSWIEEIRDNLIKAMRGGIALYPGCHTRTAFDIQGMDEIFHVPVSEFNSEYSSRSLLTFNSPLCLRRGYGAVMGHDRELLLMLLNRIIALAKWQDLAIEDVDEYEQNISNIECNSSQLDVVISERYSSAQKKKQHIMLGCRGSIILNGDVNEIAPLLQLGEICGFGSHTTMGMGHYELSFY